MDCGAETKDMILEVLKGCIRGCEEITLRYGAEIWKFKKHLESKLLLMEMDF